MNSFALCQNCGRTYIEHKAPQRRCPISGGGLLFWRDKTSGIPAKIVKIEGYMALAQPIEVNKAPTSLKQGHWVAVQGLSVGVTGNLLWVPGASQGNWVFERRS